MSMSRCHKGFTLVELLVVISIIALLLSILMPSLSRAREQSKQVVCSSNLKQIALSTALYAEDNDSYIPSNSSAEYDLCRGEDSRSISGSPWPWVGVGVLYHTGYMGNSKVFYCPSNKICKYGTVLQESPPYSYAVKTIFLPRSERPDYRIMMSYQYRFSYWCWGGGDLTLSLRNKQKVKFYTLNKKGIIGDKASYDGMIHFGSRNYVYGDTHVGRIRDDDMVTGMNIYSGTWWKENVDF